MFTEKELNDLLMSIEGTIRMLEHLLTFMCSLPETKFAKESISRNNLIVIKIEDALLKLKKE